MKPVLNLFANANTAIRIWSGQQLKKSSAIRQFSSTSILKSGHESFYRASPTPQRKFVIAAEVAGTFMWWWVFWHLMTDYEHIIGHFPFPEIEKWSNQDLGIQDN